jgi:DNA-directed RNA polymerase sigma subunit (sigma70/sigma32)
MLPWYEQKILNLRFGLSGDKPKTLKECGNIFKCTKENIQLRQKAALTKLKELMSDSDKFFESKQYTKLYNTTLTESLS